MWAPVGTLTFLPWLTPIAGYRYILSSIQPPLDIAYWLRNVQFDGRSSCASTISEPCQPLTWCNERDKIWLWILGAFSCERWCIQRTHAKLRSRPLRYSRSSTSISTVWPDWSERLSLPPAARGEFRVLVSNCRLMFFLSTEHSTQVCARAMDDPVFVWMCQRSQGFRNRHRGRLGKCDQR